MCVVFGTILYTSHVKFSFYSHTTFILVLSPLYLLNSQMLYPSGCALLCCVQSVVKDSVPHLNTHKQPNPQVVPCVAPCVGSLDSGGPGGAV